MPGPEGCAFTSWVFLTKTAKSQFVSKIATSVRRRGVPTAGRLQEIDQFLEVDPIADIQEAVGPVEVHIESISKRGLANEVNGLSSFGPQWKSLKQRMKMGSPILDHGRAIRISPRFETLSPF